jgi:plasmid stability protein
MTPSTALDELLAQHALLREIMDRCEDLAAQLDAGTIEPWLLEPEVSRLRVTLAAHNRYEEDVLRPILRAGDVFGAVRIDQMASDHFVEHRLIEDRIGSFVTQELRATLAGLRMHIDTEERHFLSASVLDARRRTGS